MVNQLDGRRYGSDGGGTCHGDWLLGRWGGVMEVRGVGWEELGLQARLFVID